MKTNLNTLKASSIFRNVAGQQPKLATSLGNGIFSYDQGSFERKTKRVNKLLLVISSLWAISFFLMTAALFNLIRVL